MWALHREAAAVGSVIVFCDIFALASFSHWKDVNSL